MVSWRPGTRPSFGRNTNTSNFEIPTYARQRLQGQVSKQEWNVELDEQEKIGPFWVQDVDEAWEEIIERVVDRMKLDELDTIKVRQLSDRAGRNAAGQFNVENQRPVIYLRNHPRQNYKAHPDPVSFVLCKAGIWGRSHVGWMRPEYVFVHEIAHYLHYRNVIDTNDVLTGMLRYVRRGREFTGPYGSTKKTISRYATEDNNEFVAEVFTHVYRHGDDLPEDIQAHYLTQEGPIPEEWICDL